MLKINLVAQEAELFDAWTKHCGDLSFVKVCCGSIFDFPTDAVVSPANSFGFMDGGIDLAYSNRFPGVQDEVQSVIIDEYSGELLVGQALLVGTEDVDIPMLIAAPTMRVPMVLGRETVAPYLAARAVLLLITQKLESGVKTVSFPGLGTGVGRVRPDVCARQMRAAINEVLLQESSFPQTAWESAIRHQQLYGSEVRELQNAKSGEA